MLATKINTGATLKIFLLLPLIITLLNSMAYAEDDNSLFKFKSFSAEAKTPSIKKTLTVDDYIIPESPAQNLTPPKASPCSHSNCGHNHEKPAMTIKFSEVKDEATRRIFEQNIIHEAHEVMEGQAEGNYLNQWLEKMNLKAKFIDSYRWYSSHKNHGYEDIVFDSLFMFSVSHMIEMSSGPLAFAYGYQHDWPAWLLTIIGTGGAIISAPGFDPLCLIIFATYYKSDKFRGKVKSLRVAVVKGGTYLYQISQIDRLFKHYVTSENLAQKLLQHQGLSEIQILNSNETKYVLQWDQGNSKPLTMSLILQNNEVYLKDINVENASFSQIPPHELKEWLNPLGWNIKNFVLQIQYQIQSNLNIPEKIYFESIDATENKTQINLKPQAVTLKPGWKLKTLDCLSLFAGS